jgi:RNA polymerase sigma-70 factor (ECF subfamily)
VTLVIPTELNPPARRPATWETLYRDNVTWVLRLMAGKVGSWPDAEDLTTEVFLTALPRLHGEADARQVRAYLRATARTVLAGYWRSTFTNEATAAELATLAGMEPDHHDRGGASQLRANLILDALPERYRQVLRLRFLRSYSLKETASELGISLANAKVMQHRALRLAAKLADPVLAEPVLADPVLAEPVLANPGLAAG